MKNSIRFFLLLTLLGTTPALLAQVRTPDSLVHQVFSALKAKDEKAFVALYPNGQQLSRFMRNIMEQAFKSDNMKEMMGMNDTTNSMNIDSLIDLQVAMFSVPENVEKMQEEFAKSFQEVIAKGEKKGVNWSKAQLTSFTLDTTSLAANEAIPFQPTGLKEVKGVIDFTVGDTAYQLVFDKMMYIESERGWFGAEFPQLARKGESLEPDREAPKEADTVPEKKTEPVKKGTTPTAPKKPAVKPAVQKKS